MPGAAGHAFSQQGSDSGVVAKLWSIGVSDLGLEPWSHHFDFKQKWVSVYLLLLSSDITKATLIVKANPLGLIGANINILRLQS